MSLLRKSIVVMRVLTLRSSTTARAPSSPVRLYQSLRAVKVGLLKQLDYCKKKEKEKKNITDSELLRKEIECPLRR